MLCRPGVPMIVVAVAIVLTACTKQELDHSLNGIATATDADKSVERVAPPNPDLDFAPTGDGEVRYCRRPGCTGILFWDRHDLGTTTGMGMVQASVYLSGEPFVSDEAVKSLNSTAYDDARMAEITLTFDFPDALPLLADIQGSTDTICSGSTGGMYTAPEVPGVVVGHIDDLQVTYTTTATIRDHVSAQPTNGIVSHEIDVPDAPEVSFSVSHEDNHFLCDLAAVLSASDQDGIEAGLRTVFDSQMLRDRIAADLNARLAQGIRSELQLTSGQTYRAHIFFDDEVVVSYVW